MWGPLFALQNSDMEDVADVPVGLDFLRFGGQAGLQFALREDDLDLLAQGVVVGGCRYGLVLTRRGGFHILSKSEFGPVPPSDRRIGSACKP